MVELELRNSGDRNLVIIHVKATLLQKFYTHSVLKTSNSWRFGVRIFRVGLFLVIIGEGSCSWKWWSGFRCANGWSSPSTIFFFPKLSRKLGIYNIVSQDGGDRLIQVLQMGAGINFFFFFKLKSDV